MVDQPTDGAASWAERTTCWDVVAEHLDEAAFAVEALLHLQQHPIMTLRDQVPWGEERLEAHVDGLVVGGPIVAERTLLPELAEPATDEPERLTAATMALLRGGYQREALAISQHDDTTVRRAGALAFRWAGREGRGFELAAQRLSTQLPAVEQAGLLELCAVGQIEVPQLASYLQGPDPAVIKAATALCLNSANPAPLRPLIEDLLACDNAELAGAALIPGLAWNSQAAHARLYQYAAADKPDSHVLALYSALTGKNSHGVIVEHARGGPGQEAALFALGYSGDIQHTTLLLDMLSTGKPRTAALAAQSLALLFGLDLSDDTLFLPPKAHADNADEGDEDLPAFDEDDLDADLMPLPEEALDPPNATAFAAAVEEHQAGLNPATRYLRGTPFSAAALVEALTHGSLRTRHVLTDLLTILSAGAHRVDTHALVHQQQQQLDALRTPAQLQLTRNPLH